MTMTTTANSTTVTFDAAAGIATTSTVAAPVETIDTIDWPSLGLGDALVQFLHRGQIYLSGQPHTQPAIDKLLELGWVRVPLPGTAAARYYAPGNLPAGVRPDPAPAPARSAIAKLEGLANAAAAAVARVSGPVPEAELTDAQRVAAAIKSVRDSHKYGRVYQVWVVIDDNGNTSYLSKTSKRVKSVGQIIDVSSDNVTMCRPGTLGSRFLLDAYSRNSGSEFKRAARLELYGELTNSGETFIARKGVVLGIISLAELKDFMFPPAEPKPEPAPMSLAEIYRQFRIENATYFQRNGPTRDSLRNSMAESWVELAETLDREEMPTNEQFYRAAYLTVQDGMSSYVGLGDWFGPDYSGLDRGRALTAFRSAARKLEDGWKEKDRARKPDHNLHTMDRKELELKTREFFASKYPGIKVKDAGLRKDSDPLDPRARPALT